MDFENDIVGGLFMRGIKRDWAKLDRLYEKSDLSQHDFCSKYNIPDSTLRNHLIKKKSNTAVSTDKSPAIVPVDIIPEIKCNAVNNEIGSICLKINDAEIILNEGFNRKLLKEVLDVLRTSC